MILYIFFWKYHGDVEFIFGLFFIYINLKKRILTNRSFHVNIYKHLLIAYKENFGNGQTSL